LRTILNTQRDFDRSEQEEDQRKEGFMLQRSMNKVKHVGRLRVELAQVINSQDEREQIVEASWEHDESPMIRSRTAIIDDPYAVDIATLPTGMAARASFQDYIDDGCQIDFCVAIDFTSSNGRYRRAGRLAEEE
jgi:hypothetical protein